MLEKQQRTARHECKHEQMAQICIPWMSCILSATWQTPGWSRPHQHHVTTRSYTCFAQTRASWYTMSLAPIVPLHRLAGDKPQASLTVLRGAQTRSDEAIYYQERWGEGRQWPSKWGESSVTLVWNCRWALGAKSLPPLWGRVRPQQHTHNEHQNNFSDVLLYRDKIIFHFHLWQ